MAFGTILFERGMTFRKVTGAGDAAVDHRITDHRGAEYQPQDGAGNFQLGQATVLPVVVQLDALRFLFARFSRWHWLDFLNGYQYFNAVQTCATSNPVTVTDKPI